MGLRITAACIHFFMCAGLSYFYAPGTDSRQPPRKSMCAPDYPGAVIAASSAIRTESWSDAVAIEAAVLSGPWARHRSFHTVASHSDLSVKMLHVMRSIADGAPAISGPDGCVIDIFLRSSAELRHWRCILPRELLQSAVSYSKDTAHTQHDEGRVHT
eukprot:COSAG01_NODE_7533_length_3162_cov_875.130591_3_plen_158_part_00